MLGNLKLLFQPKLFWLALVLMYVVPQGASAESSDMQITEATHYFRRLMLESTNPVIATMAQWSLDYLHQDDHARTLRSVEIPLTSSGSSGLMVTAQISAKSQRVQHGQFMFDTGSTYSLITPRFARQLGIQITSNTPHRLIYTANGSMTVPLVELDNVTVGAYRIPKLQAVIKDIGDNEGSLAGLFGMNVFQNHDFSLQKNKVIVYLK